MRRVGRQSWRRVASPCHGAGATLGPSGGRSAARVLARRRRRPLRSARSSERGIVVVRAQIPTASDLDDARRSNPLCERAERITTVVPYSLSFDYRRLRLREVARLIQPEDREKNPRLNSAYRPLPDLCPPDRRLSCCDATLQLEDEELDSEETKETRCRH